jgi:hypothetical protein
MDILLRSARHHLHRRRNILLVPSGIQPRPSHPSRSRRLALINQLAIKPARRSKAQRAVLNLAQPNTGWVQSENKIKGLKGRFKCSEQTSPHIDFNPTCDASFFSTILFLIQPLHLIHRTIPLNHLRHFLRPIQLTYVVPTRHRKHMFLVMPHLIHHTASVK